MKREVEVLYPLVSSWTKAISALSRFDAKGRKKTVDTYFYDPKRPTLKPKRGRLMNCCRLRNKGGQWSFAYKIDQFDGDTWLYSDEHETTVTDGQAMLEIIRHLGLEVLVTVDMVKVIFESPDFEIALEQVKGLGNFLEVETRRAIPEREAPKEKQRIRDFVDLLGLKVGEECNAGKPEMLIRSYTPQTNPKR